MKLHKLLALLLTLAMVLPMVVGIVPASAEETAVEEIPTETMPSTVDQTDSTGQTIPDSTTWDFSDESQLADFSLYQSSTSAFTVADGMLKPNGTDGELKAILNQAPADYHSVSVDMIPGESGVIYAGLYFGASDAANEQDAINSQAFLIKSDYTGWTDAPNRIDIIQGQFDSGWKLISTKISETGNGNNLFSGGTKQPLRLKLTFSGDVVLLTLSLVSNSAKYVQYMYEYDAADLQGQIGLRTISSDTCLDNLTFEYNTALPEGTLLWDLNSMAQAQDFTIPEGDGKAEFSGAYLLAQGTSNSIHHQKLITLERDLKNLKSVSFDILSGTTSRNWGGICLYNDSETFTVNAGSFWNTSANYDDCRIEMTGVDNVDVADFFTTGTSRTRNNINVTLTFADGTVTATVTRLTDEPATMTSTASFDMTTWEGKLGFWVHGSQVKYDNLKIEYDPSVKNTNTYQWNIGTEVADAFTVPEGDGAVTFGTSQMVVTGTSADIQHQKLVSLNQKLNNIKSITYTQLSGSTTRNWGGICLYNDTSEFNVEAGGYWNDASSYYNDCLLQVTGAEDVAVEDFFTSGTSKKRNNIQVDLVFEDGMVNVTVTRLTTEQVTMTSSAPFDMENWEGQLGFWVNGSKVGYSALTVVCEEESQCYIAPPSQEMQIPQDAVSYDNTGYSFGTDTNTWKLSDDLSSTPYTLEAWVKIPAGVDDGATGNIIGNTLRMSPKISMELVSGGRPQLTYAMENADLSTTTNTYAVDVDLRVGQWIHVAYTMDVANDTVICYINGHVMQTWTDAGLQAVTIPDHVKPGDPFQVGSTSLLGWVADVRMWDHPLTADEINSSMKTQYTLAKDGLIFNAPLNEKVENAFADLSGNDNSVLTWTYSQNFVEETHEPGSYSIVVIPDQQILTHYAPDVLMDMYQWIADNREKENIQIVLNVGDIADNCGNVTQWETSRAAWELLPEDLPFIAVPGNHDYDTNSGWNKGYGVREQLTLMNQYFPMSIFENYSTEFGALSREQGAEDNIANTYQAFEVNGNKYLILALEYVPRDDAVAWANEVIETHPNHQVIMLTHSYVHAPGNIGVAPGYLWPDLVSKHENVIMAFSGHSSSPNVIRRTDIGVNGNAVHQMLMDVQSNDTSQRLGMLGLIRFNEDGTQCEVSYYSTRLGMYDSKSTFTLELPKQEHKYSALVGLNSYETVTEAIANANGGIVKILKDTDEAITVDADLTIDLAGCTLSNVTVAEGYSLKLIDTVSGGSAAVTGSVEGMTEVNSEIYWVTGENDVYTAKYCVAELAQQVSLGDDLAMNFAFRADKGTTVNVIFDGAMIPYDLSTMTVDSYGKYTVSIDLAAAQMTENIELQFVVGDVAVLEKTYSIRSYAEEILAGDYDDSTKNLVKAMLNYGAKAQLYFDVNADNLANAGYELEDAALPTEYEEMSASGSISGLSFYGASLLFKNKIAVRFYFTGSVEGVSFGDYEAVPKGDMYYVEVADINPQDYSNLIALTATKGEETLTVSYSPLNYILRMSGRDTTSAELKALVNALYGYHAAAVQYVSA